MTSAAQEIISSFEHLSKAEQIEVVNRLCAMAARWESSPISDEALSEIAAETFRELDERETSR